MTTSREVFNTSAEMLQQYSRGKLSVVEQPWGWIQALAKTAFKVALDETQKQKEMTDLALMELVVRSDLASALRTQIPDLGMA